MERMLDTPQCAEVLGMRPQTLTQWRHQRTGPRYYRLGRQVRYKLADVEAWRDQQLVEPLDAA